MASGSHKDTVSIPAPAWGATDDDQVVELLVRFLSPLPRGERLQIMVTPNFCICFHPAPAGERLWSAVYPLFIECFIPLPRGATHTNEYISTQHSSFYPAPAWGARTTTRLELYPVSSCSCGERHVYRRNRLNRRSFHPRSRGERRKAGCNKGVRAIPPRGERLAYRREPTACRYPRSRGERLSLGLP